MNAGPTTQRSLAVLAQATDAGTEASQRLSWIIVALIGLAVLIGVVTLVFFRLTSPARVAVRRGAAKVSADRPEPPPDPR